MSTVCSDAQIEAMKVYLVTNPGAVLSINSIPQSVKKEDLEAYFGQFGEIQEIRVPRNFMDPKGVKHRGLCMMTFVDSQVLPRVLGMAQQKAHEIKGQKLVTGVMTYSEIQMMGEKPLVQKVMVGPQPAYQGFGTCTFRRVFVKMHNSTDIDDQEFHRYWSQFGDVDFCSRGTSRNAGNLGLGFVTYKHVEPAVLVVQISRHYIDGNMVVATESEEGGEGGAAAEVYHTRTPIKPNATRPKNDTSRIPHKSYLDKYRSEAFPSSESGSRAPKMPKMPKMISNCSPAESGISTEVDPQVEAMRESRARVPKMPLNKMLSGERAAATSAAESGIAAESGFAALAPDPMFQSRSRVKMPRKIEFASRSTAAESGIAQDVDDTFESRSRRPNKVPKRSDDLGSLIQFAPRSSAVAKDVDTDGW